MLFVGGGWGLLARLPAVGPRGSLSWDPRVRVSERGTGRQHPKIQTPSTFGSSLGVRGEEITGTRQALRNDEIHDCSVMCKRLESG